MPADSENISVNKPRFAADCHLGKLAKYLRFMGYNTLYFSHIDDGDLVTLARRESRIILTHDRELSRRQNVSVFLLESEDISEELRALAERFGIGIKDDESRRCLICNSALRTINKEFIGEEVPKNVKARFDFFQQCPTCGRIYWQGDHYHNMMAFIESALSDTE